MKRRRKIYDYKKRYSSMILITSPRYYIFKKTMNIFQQKFVRNSMCVRIKYISLWFRVVLLLILKCFCNFSLLYYFFILSSHIILYLVYLFFICIFVCLYNSFINHTFKVFYTPHFCYCK